MDSKELIARRVALELRDGDVVNLGIGLPTTVANYLPKGVEVTLQSENGFLGLSALKEEIPNVVNAGGKSCGIIDGASFFDSALSFALIRGGHVDVSVLGGLEVDENRNLANWMVPGKMIPGMGGAMDLVVGSKQVIVAMEHCSKDGSSKILKSCTLPLTAKEQVDVIVTELALFRFKDKVMFLEELAPNITLENVKKSTSASFIVSNNLKEMNLSM